MFVAIYYLLFSWSYVHFWMNQYIHIIEINQFVLQMKFILIQMNQTAYREKTSK